MILPQFGGRTRWRSSFDSWARALAKLAVTNEFSSFALARGITSPSSQATSQQISKHVAVFALCFRVVRPSVRLSVGSLKYPLFTCTWVSWSNRPTVTVLRHVRPSVHPERFPGICRRMHGGIGLKFYMLMYLDHLQNWLVYGRGLLIFSCNQAALQMVFSVCPSVVSRSC